MSALRRYLAELAELAGGLLCALLNHAGGCAVLRYGTRRWNPVAALYHWGTDVAAAAGRETARCGCVPAGMVTAEAHEAALDGLRERAAHLELAVAILSEPPRAWTYTTGTTGGTDGVRWPTVTQ